jgi:hypothetical protein
MARPSPGGRDVRWNDASRSAINLHGGSPSGDHRLHGVSNEDPTGGEAENGADQAGDENVKSAAVRLGCHSRSSDSSAQANLEHGRILERLLNSRCEICHATGAPGLGLHCPSESTLSLLFETAEMAEMRGATLTVSHCLREH